MGVYQNDSALPALPVPELGDTCRVLKQMVRPLLSENAYEKTCSEIELFQSDNGAGPVLHSYLQSWQKTLPGNASWLRPVWDDNYLTYRDVLPSMNFCLELVTGRWGENGLPALVWALARQIRLLRKEKLEPETTKSGNMSMDCLHEMLYTRIPDEEKDMLFFPPLTAPLTVAVACKGRWFVLELTDGDELVSQGRIHAALEEIRHTATGQEPSKGASSFTAAGREQAAAIRKELLKHPLNRISLSGLERAVFAVCLDDTDAEKSFLSTLLFGAPENRWFDKSLQIIADKNNRIGLNLEHAGCDAAFWVYLFGLADECAQSAPAPEETGEKPAHFRQLDWYISREAGQLLQKAAAEHLRRETEIQLAEKPLTGIGKKRIKKADCRPDTFVQMLYQSVYYQLTGQLRSVYEAVAVRQFFQGRTECARPLSEDSAGFVRAFINGTAAPEQLKELLHAAEKAHSDQLDRAKEAMGAERHLSGLRAMLGMYGDQADSVHPGDTGLFESEGYRALTHDHLSTSSITAPFIQYFSFAPVVSDGIGIGYGIKHETLQMAVSAQRDSGIDPDEFIRAMEAQAEKLFEILE